MPPMNNHVMVQTIASMVCMVCSFLRGGGAQAPPVRLALHDWEGRFHGPNPFVDVSDGLVILAPLVGLAGDFAGKVERARRSRGPRQAEPELASPQSVLNRPSVQEARSVRADEACHPVAYSDVAICHHCPLTIGRRARAARHVRTWSTPGRAPQERSPSG